MTSHLPHRVRVVLKKEFNSVEWSSGKDGRPAACGIQDAGSIQTHKTFEVYNHTRLFYQLKHDELHQGETRNRVNRVSSNCGS